MAEFEDIKEELSAQLAARLGDNAEAEQIIGQISTTASKDSLDNLAEEIDKLRLIETVKNSAAAFGAGIMQQQDVAEAVEKVRQEAGLSEEVGDELYAASVKTAKEIDAPKQTVDGEDIEEIGKPSATPSKGGSKGGRGGLN